MAPRKLYLLFDDQPPKMTEYTARLLTAKTKRIPTSMPGSTTNCGAAGSLGFVDPNGTTAKPTAVVNTAIAGASTYSTLFAPAGINGSLRISLPASAIGCSNPCQPTRL